jgi:ATP/maltotriose-dependent transcriptional regulator MalT
MSSARVIDLPRPSVVGPPTGDGLLVRERLMRRLDTAAGRCVWLAAPAGYGKSSLAASFVRSRARPCVWLRLSAADADAAGFFAHLSAAAGARLPVPQAEQLGDLAVFARRYFAALFAGLPVDGVLVLDEAEAAAEALQAVLAEAVAAVPPAMLVMVTSRTAPPSALARARVEGRLATIETAELALTPDEIAAMFAQRRREAAAQDVDAVFRRTLGWPAAVSLTLLAGPGLPQADDDVLRDYLQHEVWPAFDVATRERLLVAAQLPYVDAALERAWPRLAGTTAMLERFARRGLFVLTDQGDEPRHVLHPLIREFLRRHAQEALPPAELAALQRDAARALADAGDTEAAAPALLEAGDLERAAGVVRALAPRFVAQARLRTLGAWLAAFPAAWRESQPDLEYWLGLVWVMTKPARAREHLLRAAAGYAARGDASGRLRTLAHLAYLSFVDFAPEYPITHWLDELHEVTPQFDALPSAEEKAQLAMTVVYALLVGEPAHPELPRWRERALDALHAPIGLQLRARVASVLGINLLWSGLFEQLGAMHDGLARPIAQQGLTDYGRLIWGLVELKACWAQARLAEAPAVLRRLLATGEQCGIHGLDTYHRLLANDARLAAGDLDAADALLAEARAKMLPTQLTEVWHAAFQAAWLALWRGDGATALREGRAAIDAARAIRSPMCEALGAIAQALARRQRGSDADVEATLAALRELAARSGSAMVEFHLHDLQAWLARRRGDAAGEAAALAEAVRRLARHDIVYPALGTDAALAETASAALAHGVETSFVQGWVRRRGLPAPGDTVAPDWPYPLRLRVLGGFDVALDGQPLTFEGKVQKRPLELLQALAVHGPAPVPVARLVDDLWPELDGDAARKSFDAALHRLRKLLGDHGNALRLEAGAVHLDTARIGCDLWALRRLADVPAADLQARPTLAAWARGRGAAALLPLQQAPWAVAARQHHVRQVQRRLGGGPSIDDR